MLKCNAVTVYVLKQLGTIVLDGNFLLVDLWLRNIVEMGCCILRKQQYQSSKRNLEIVLPVAKDCLTGMYIPEKVYRYADLCEPSSKLPVCYHIHD